MEVEHRGYLYYSNDLEARRQVLKAFTKANVKNDELCKIYDSEN